MATYQLSLGLPESRDRDQEIVDTVMDFASLCVIRRRTLISRFSTLEGLCAVLDCMETDGTLALVRWANFAPEVP